MLKRKSQTDKPSGTPKRSSTDPLTNLPRRDQLPAWLTDRASRAQATSKRVSLFMVGVGNLRDVNDTYGPEVGDGILKEVAGRMSTFVGKNGAVCRYNAGEFAAVIDGVSSADRAREIAAALLAVLDEPFPNNGVNVPVFSQVGAALSDPGHADSQAWLDDAHDALVAARDQGLGSVVVNDESTRNRIDVQINEERIRNAFDNDEFVVVYQPIVSPADAEIVGFEALLRWLDPSSGIGLISPAKFLPLLEKTGLITPVGTWTLSQAVGQIAEWNRRRDDKPPLFVSVNLGAKQMAEPSFADTVVKALDDVSFRPELLSLDVTPAALKYNKTATWSALRGLSSVGIRIALDDFGVGESSMVYLRELQVDLLRIDRMFVKGLNKTPEDTAIVRHLIGIGRDLGILTLAEGVETPDQVIELQKLGCPLAQGWHFGRPAQASEVEAQFLA
jgi:diguanylate cyclase (GGDEF)-like protein